MRRVVLACVIVAAAAGAFAVITQLGRAAALWVGGALILTGLPLMGLARIHIGNAFAVTPQAKGLVTRGLYARIPHPLYVFLDVALLGAAIAVRQPWFLLPWLALVAVHAWAARREARVLERAFGDAYRQYRATTWW